MSDSIFGGICLFEIPIYSMEKDIFRNKWETRVDSCLKDSRNVYDDVQYNEIRQRIREHYVDQMSWSYNQIVACVTVNVWRKDITFDIYKPFNKMIRYDRSRKVYMRSSAPPGCHFRYIELSDSEIKLEIKKWVSSIIEEDFKKPRFADIELFEATIDCVDIRKLIDLRKQQDR